MTNLQKACHRNPITLAFNSIPSETQIQKSCKILSWDGH